MKQIIRSNAVETISQRDNLGKQPLKLQSCSVCGGSLVLSARVNFSVLPPGSKIVINNKSNRLTFFPYQLLSVFPHLKGRSKLDVLPRVVFWVCREKIAQISVTVINRNLEKIKTRFVPLLWEFLKVNKLVEKPVEIRYLSIFSTFVIH